MSIVEHDNRIQEGEQPIEQEQEIFSLFSRNDYNIIWSSMFEDGFIENQQMNRISLRVFRESLFRIVQV